MSGYQYLHHKFGIVKNVAPKYLIEYSRVDDSANITLTGSCNEQPAKAHIIQIKVNCGFVEPLPSTTM